jgi:lipopolysaccharide export system protein LptA
MKAVSKKVLLVLFLVLGLPVTLLSLTIFVSQIAVAQGIKPREVKSNSPLQGIGGNSREPIKIDSDRLDVFDRENRAVFSGNVVAVQGETTMRCTQLMVFYEAQKPASSEGQKTATSPMSASGDAIRRIECKGPVTVASKEQVATSRDAVFDRVANRVVLTGDAALSDGRNVTRGERIVYNLTTGVANVETVPGGRVRALFVPGDEAVSGAAKPKTR